MTLVSRYFDRHRALAIGLVSSGIGIGLFFMPPFIQYLNRSYGWRGSLVMLSALMVQFIVLASFMKPITIPEDDDVDSINEIRTDESECYGVCHYLQLSIFRERRFVLLCLNNAFVMYGSSVFIVHIAAYAKTVGVHEASWLFSALGASSYVGRVFYGIIGQHSKMDFVLAYGLSLVVAGLPIVVLPKVFGLIGIMAVAALHGFGTAVLGSYTPQLVINFLGLRKLPEGYGYLLVFEGIGTLLGAPCAGKWVIPSKSGNVLYI